MIVFIRHATSTYNESGDESPNVPLSENGKQQAKTKLIGKVNLVLCSTMKRARQTLDESSIEYEEVIFTDLAREWRGGHAPDYYAGEGRVQTVSVPAVEGGAAGATTTTAIVYPRETREEFISRVKTLLAMIKDLSRHYERIAVISHAGVITSIFNKPVDNCEVLALNLIP